MVSSKVCLHALHFAIKAHVEGSSQGQNCPLPYLYVSLVAKVVTDVKLDKSIRFTYLANGGFTLIGLIDSSLVLIQSIINQSFP